MNNRCDLYKIYNDEILVDGINIYNEDTVQFRLYTIPGGAEDNFYVFPITAGLQFFGDYYILNNEDCIGVYSMADIISMCKGDYILAPKFTSGYLKVINDDALTINDSAELSITDIPGQMSIFDYDVSFEPDEALEEAVEKENFRLYDFDEGE